ncbi:hypothetical protein [Coralliovum pocilloporae]|uniref:hypothetical protein n=1 Tax=Coralliovum pocilloporae TaxID=3066369 RepID=UPI0033070303
MRWLTLNTLLTALFLGCGAMAQNGPTPPPRPGGVIAAPNLSNIEAVLTSLSPVEDIPGKTDLEFKTVIVKPLSGPTFAEPGETLPGFTFQDVTGLSTGDRVSMETEYIGGPKGGLYQVIRIEKLP